MDIRARISGNVAHLPPVATHWPFDTFREELESLRDQVRVVALPFEPQKDAPGWTPEQLLWLERYPLPTVAALTGEVTGTALDLALAFDIRIADEDAVLVFRKLGGRRMQTLLGIDRAVTVLERRGQVDASTALDVGLISVVTKPGELSHELERLPAVIASRGPIATQLGKEAIWRGLRIDFEQALRFETDLTLLLQTTNDRAEGVRAFLEKRTPEFTGK